MKILSKLLMVIVVLSFGFGGSVLAADGGIVIGIHPSPWYPAFRTLVDTYVAETGRSIELLEFPHPSLMENQMIAAIEGTDTFDIMSVDDAYVPFFVGGDRRYLTPIQDIDPDFELGPEIIDFQNSFRWSHELNYSHPDGTLYAIPTQGNFQMFFYLGELFEEAGLSHPPQTWEEVRMTAEQLHQAPSMYGYATTTVHRIQAVYFWMPILRGFGGDIFADPPYDWTVVINSDEARQSLEWILDMKQFCPPGIGNTSQSDVLSYLGNSQVVQALNVTAVYPFMDDPDYSAFPGEVDFAPPPAGPDGLRSSTIGNWLALIPQTSQRKEEALDFLKWFLLPENQVIFGEAGGVPSSLEAIQELASRADHEYRFFRAYLDTFEYMQERPRIMEWPQIEDIIGTYFQEVVVETLSIDEALENMATEIEAVMQEAGFLSQ